MNGISNMELIILTVRSMMGPSAVWIKALLKPILRLFPPARMAPVMFSFNDWSFKVGLGDAVKRLLLFYPYLYLFCLRAALQAPYHSRDRVFYEVFDKGLQFYGLTVDEKAYAGCLVLFYDLFFYEVGNALEVVFIIDGQAPRYAEIRRKGYQVFVLAADRPRRFAFSYDLYLPEGRFLEALGDDYVDVGEIRRDYPLGRPFIRYVLYYRELLRGGGGDRRRASLLVPPGVLALVVYLKAVGVVLQYAHAIAPAGELTDDLLKDSWRHKQAG